MPGTGLPPRRWLFISRPAPARGPSAPRSRRLPCAALCVMRAAENTPEITKTGGKRKKTGWENTGKRILSSSAPGPGAFPSAGAGGRSPGLRRAGLAPTGGLPTGVRGGVSRPPRGDPGGAPRVSHLPPPRGVAAAPPPPRVCRCPPPPRGWAWGAAREGRGRAGRGCARRGAEGSAEQGRRLRGGGVGGGLGGRCGMRCPAGPGAAPDGM